MDLIDIDKPKIWVKYLKHFREDHKFAYIRRSSSGNIHIVVDKYCAECRKPIDVRFENIFFQNNKGDKFVSSFIDATNGKKVDLSDHFEMKMLIYGVKFGRECSPIGNQYLVDSNINDIVQKEVSNGRSVFYTVISIFKPNTKKITPWNFYIPDWRMYMEYFDKYDGKTDLQQLFEFEKGKIENKCKNLPVPKLYEFLSDLDIHNKKLYTISKAGDSNVEHMVEKFGVDESKVREKIDDLMRNFDNTIDFQTACNVINAKLENGIIDRMNLM